jgi:hypothetical protein
VSYLGMFLTFFWWLGILNMSVLLTYHSWYQFGFFNRTFDFMSFCDYHFRWYFTIFRSTFFVGYPSTPYDHLFPDNKKARMKKMDEEVRELQRNLMTNRQLIPKTKEKTNILTYRSPTDRTKFNELRKYKNNNF